MGTYYVGPTSRGSANGSSAGNEISLQDAMGGTGWSPSGGWQASGGHTFILRGGIYAYRWQQTVSGLDNNNRLRYEPYSGESALIDCSYGATSQYLANPDPWVNVPKESGFSGPVGYNYQPRNTSGNPVGGTIAQSYIYQKTWSNDLGGIFCDAPLSGMGIASVADIHSVMVNMGYGEGNFVNYSGGGSDREGNPAGPSAPPQFHDYDPNHDGPSLFPLHDWKGQYIEEGGLLRLRLYTTTANDPNSHYIYIPRVDQPHNLELLNCANITIDGINKRIRFWRAFHQNVVFNNATNCAVRNCDIAFAVRNGIYFWNGSKNCALEYCNSYAGGSMLRHADDQIGMQVGGKISYITIKGCLISHSGHAGIGVSGDHHTIDGNTIQRCCGTGIWMNGADDCTVRNNILKDIATFNYNGASPAGYDNLLRLHVVSHKAIHVRFSNRNLIERNLIYRCQVPIGLMNHAPNANCADNVIRNNTAYGCEAHAIEWVTEAASTDTSAGMLRNVIVNNVFHRLSLNGEPSNHTETLAMWAEGKGFLNVLNNNSNKIANNQFMVPGASPGGNIFRYWDVGGGSVTWRSLSGMDTAHPNLMRLSGQGSSQNIESTAADATCFQNVGAEDFRLAAGSPFRNVGSNAYSDTQVTDGQPDLGYQEYGASGGGTNNAPSVSLSANVTTGNAPLAVTFTATVTDETPAANCSYAWNFGDVNSGSNTASGTGLTGPSHTYNNPGTYTVTLTVTDAGSPTQQTQKTMVINVTSAAAGTQLTNSGVVFTSGPGTPVVSGSITRGPSKLMDGLYKSNGGTVDNCWSQSGLPGTPQWAKLDLGSAQTISRVRFAPFDSDLGRSYNYTLETSLNDSTWSAIATAAASLTGSGNEFSEFAFSPRSARYIRLTCNSSSDGSAFATIAEMQVWASGGGLGPRLNIVTATDHLGRGVNERFGPGRLIDLKHQRSNAPWSIWVAQLIDPSNTWFQLDFGADVGVKTLRLYWHRQSLFTHTYDVQYATAAAYPTLTTLLSNQTSAGSGDYTTHTFGATTTMRYLRVKVKGLNSGQCVRCWEVETYGP